MSEAPLPAALPRAHARASDDPLTLAGLREAPCLPSLRSLGPTLFDAVVGACHAAGFEPRPGRTPPQIASIVNLAAAQPGASLVPASTAHLPAAGVADRPIRGNTQAVLRAIAGRPGDACPIVRNFVTGAAA